MGVMAHDWGPASDHHESGIDLNVEVLFTPINIIGMPRPHLGTTLNFNGDTSIVYAGLTFPFYESRRWFGSGFVGGVVHDGPLHKDPVGCKKDSDCGFGVRFLPRIGLELGYYLSGDTAVSLHYDHMSHKGIISGENEGIEHMGLRYRRPF
jgi:lipid A 3-O-deacylase